MQQEIGKKAINFILSDQLVDDYQRSRLQMSVVSAMFGLISAIMCIVNIAQNDMDITIATMIFSIVSFINVAILATSTKGLTASYCIFGANLLMLSAYLLVFDETETGFLWLLLLPACGPMLMGRHFGCILSILLFLEVAFLMWTPLGNQYLAGDTPHSFCVRYPFIFICFFFVGIWLEYIREKTNDALQKLQKQFKEMSFRDALTGLYNRHWINNEMPLAMKRCKGRKLLGVIILDLDLFKHINDTYGHIFGDYVLKSVADILRNTVGERGNVCRWGGEEFAILIEDIQEDEIKALAEKIRKAVEEKVLEDDGEEVHITISAGVTCMIPTADMRPGFLIDIADSALYKAKESGRNSVKYQVRTWRYREIDG